jgi:ferredoxin-NADP reductase
MSYKVKILQIHSLTHDVKRITTEKPDGYSFEPGQATEVAIDMAGYRDEKRPFTFTSLPTDDTLEFTIKSYHDHDGVTHKIDSLSEGDGLIVDDAWGAIQYKGEGTFIAGGAGITPFIAIFRDLKSQGKLENHSLIFSNKTAKDVIMEEEFRKMLGDNFISTLTREDAEGHAKGHIEKGFLQNRISDFSQHFYVCGPDKMVEQLNETLEELGASSDALVFEE